MTIIIIIIIYHLSFVFLFWMDGWMDGWDLPIMGRKHTSTNLKVLAWAFFFFVLFDMVYGYATIRYGMGTVWLWLWVWYMVYGFGSG